ncbi:MAG: hypothetical protein HETSPECPRED_001792 [Heterodermia speciosa]|uniref:Uncharacterized protein n=1 Tax=Heterodermia speciosa TaxID=116794 RepID=A0A8H3J2F2_9LECA|nr:MAG: hypothetical protein HETSPECPRED_001792 [Heterodermia speciosa]
MAPPEQSESAQGRHDINPPAPNIEPESSIHHDCLCHLPSNHEEKPIQENAKPCNKHRMCCPSCQPTCHDQTPIDEETAPDPTVSILDRLHPIPRNLPRSREGDQARARKKHEEETWQIHINLLKKLAHNPYEDCICDIVGLDKSFHIVQDPRSQIEYAHRPDCLMYPEIKDWEPDPRHSILHAAQADRIQGFRTVGRSRTGRKQYAKKAALDIVGLCGLRHRSLAKKMSKNGKKSSEMVQGLESPAHKEHSHKGLPKTTSPTKIKKQTTPTNIEKRYHSPSGLENAPTQYNPLTIASDILRVAGTHPSLPPLNPHLNPHLLSESTSHETSTNKPKRKRQRTSLPNPNTKKFKSAELVTPDSD